MLLWAKDQNEEMSPNLTEFTEHFNKMSYWCRTQVLQQEEARDREKVLIKFIKIMKVLRRGCISTEFLNGFEYKDRESSNKIHRAFKVKVCGNFRFIQC